MSRRTGWLVIMALCGGLVTAGSVPALARGGGGRAGIMAARVGVAPFAATRFDAGSPSTGVRPVAGRGAFARSRGVPRNAVPIIGWPYLRVPDPVPEVISLSGADAPATPQVVVLAGSPADPPRPSGGNVSRDYSYVPGCHAIPGGYHCDTSNRPGQP